MRKTLTLVCLITAPLAMGQNPGAGQNTAAQSQQYYRSRLQQRATPTNPAARQQAAQPQAAQRPLSPQQAAQQAAQQVAQPANAPRGYRPGVTIPQQAGQRAPVAQRTPVGYPAYPPGTRQPTTGQLPYNIQNPAGPGSRANADARERDNDDNEKESRSERSRDNDDSEKESKKSSDSSSSDSSRSEKKSSSNDDDNDSKKSSSDSSSALKKIVKKVESKNSDDDSDSDKKEAKAPKKSDEEIAAEKARAKALKAADEATTVVASFLKQANDGYYSKATDSLAPTIQKYFKSEISAVNGTQKTVLDELTANGTINMVTYVNTTVRGEGAVVEADLGYSDGHSVRRSFDLVKIEGDWKIVLPVTDDAAAHASQAKPAPAAPPTPEQAAAHAASPHIPLILVPKAGDGATSQPQ